MPTITTANAQPTKRFFIEMLTADIALEDAVLDLIDNSVDAITRLHNHPLDSRLIEGKQPRRPDGSIAIRISADEIMIEDDGIGMTRDEAINTAFRLGRLSEARGATLGVYGIGMKRALFKLGNAFEVISRRSHSAGFRAHLDDVERWKNLERGRHDWEIPISGFPRSESELLHGTIIRVTRIRDEVKMQMGDNSLIERLKESIGRTYALLLNRYVRIKLNGRPVDPLAIPLGSSDDLEPSIKKLSLLDGQVSGAIVAGLAAKGMQHTPLAGWYVLCNGRVVLAADRSDVSGWGADGNPLYVQSFRAFIGIVLLFSATPDLLPWRTTKRGLNKDAATFLAVKTTMWSMAKPILSFLRSYYYAADDNETAETRKLQNMLRSVDITKIGSEPDNSFISPRPTRTRKISNDVKVQFFATRQEIDRGKKLIGEPSASAGRVGRAALDLLLEGGK